MTEIAILGFKVNGEPKTFKTPLKLIIEEDNEKGKIILSNDELKIWSTGTSFSECVEEIREELEVLWKEYALAPDSKLTRGAIALKRKLLDMVEGGWLDMVEAVVEAAWIDMVEEGC